MYQNSGYFKFRIDPLLSGDLKKKLEINLAHFKESEILSFDPHLPLEKNRLLVDFLSQNSLNSEDSSNYFKICVIERNQDLFSFGQNMETAGVDAILDDGLDAHQIHRLLAPKLHQMIEEKENTLYPQGLKNLRKFESKARHFFHKGADGLTHVTSDSILNYTQALVGLEKDLIHASDFSRLEKVIKQFTKSHLEKAKFQIYSSSHLWRIVPSDNLLILPRYRGEFLVVELNWDEEDQFRFLKRFFFFHTLMSFFYSQQEIQDPFFDEGLWEEILDSIPFPIALLSEKGEVHQHNTLFAKLNFAPADCLNLKLREKILVNDIPYNIYRKDVFHLDEKKNLFVFFTESFFLKGDGNLTPSGQELGIISSSIAHELNNPIAGIQAALSLLLLDEEMNQEATLTLQEMRHGAARCKQLVETFLGFSRANPGTPQAMESKISPIDVCYQQAQNLLRFRTVESGIRFSFTYSKHTEFKAKVNLSLLTMTFYLILGEIMTLYSHQLLVANKNQIEKVIKGELVESAQEIQIQLHDLNISTLGLSKLIQNLLTIENFVLQVSDYSLRFIYSSSKAE
jgi:hypothetical protein